LLASSLAGKFDPWLFLALLAGMSLVIACGCVINNFIDRSIDVKMARTKWRRSVIRQVGPRQTIAYGIVLGVIGFGLLLAYVNPLTAAVGAVGLFFYLVMYSIWKRRSPLGTVVGSVSGAMPIVGGYTAVSDRLDGAALILFLSMVFWQMPHFYAIALYRYEDYKKAGLPVLPVVKGVRRTKLQIIAYVTAFTLAACLLTVTGYTGYVYLAAIALLGTIWLWRGLRGLSRQDDTRWGRGMFLFSLIVLMTFCVSVAAGALLP